MSNNPQSNPRTQGDRNANLNSDQRGQPSAQRTNQTRPQQGGMKGEPKVSNPQDSRRTS